MGFADFLTSLFGNKSQRDLKEINPYVERIKAIYPEIEKLSHDELRAKTLEIRQRIQDYVAVEKCKIEELKSNVEKLEIDQREELWAEIDKLEKEVTEKYEEVLDQVLPEVFSIVKDTARRFTQNEEIEVTATDLDKILATGNMVERIVGRRLRSESIKNGRIPKYMKN